MCTLCGAPTSHTASPPSRATPTVTFQKCLVSHATNNPSTTKTEVLATRWSKPACSIGAAAIPVSPSTSRGWIPYWSRSTPGTVSMISLTHISAASTIGGKLRTTVCRRSSRVTTVPPGALTVPLQYSRLHRTGSGQRRRRDRWTVRDGGRSRHRQGCPAALLYLRQFADAPPAIGEDRDVRTESMGLQRVQRVRGFVGPGQWPGSSHQWAVPAGQHPDPAAA